MAKRGKSTDTDAGLPARLASPGRLLRGARARVPAASVAVGDPAFRRDIVKGLLTAFLSGDPDVSVACGTLPELDPVCRRD